MSISINEFAAAYAECGNAYEAAVAAGAKRGAPALVEGLKCLFSRTAAGKARVLRMKRARCPADQGLRRLAFGRNNDAAALAFTENVTPEMIEQADLFGVSELKVGKGVVEIKFFDRIKALDLLNAAEKEEGSSTAAEELLGAIYGSGGDLGGEEESV
jgi:hypothetical protein